MKTNIVMKSETDRELYGVIVKQETKTGFMSLTDLQEAYTHARVLNGWKDHAISDVMKTAQNWERIYYLLKERGFIKTPISGFMGTVEIKGIVKTLKELGAYKTTGRGESKRVMCDPYIWVLVAMELNPELYAKVVIWMTDNLIINRIEAGNFCKELNSELSKLERPDYSRIAKELNTAIFGRHELGIRNTASQKDLERLYRLEGQIAFSLRNNLITSQEQISKLIQNEIKEVKQ